MELKVGSVVIELKRGDITLEDTDAIVNAANSGLCGGGGVDGAIHRSGGPSIMEECRKLGSCPTGSAVITGGGRLKARFVIHAVGPVYRGGGKGEEGLLKGAYRSCLETALDRGLKSVSFPSISTGAYGYPIDAAARAALKTVIDFVREKNGLELVRFVLFSQSDLKVYEEALKDFS
ncbi:MAG: O-acetyl-ADP-ribose deacetylase [Thermodesulfobacteriota bacterium]